MNPPRPQKLHALTSLRFFAAAMIVIHHSSGNIPIAKTITDQFHLSQAVSFFFVLSGFILTYVYPTLDSWAQRGSFLRARIGRIWPCHLVGFLLVWVVYRTPASFPTGYASVPLGIANLSLVHAWFPIRNVYSSFNFVSWTISTEFAFYLLFPLLIPSLHKTWWIKLLLSLALTAALVLYAVHAHLQPDDPSHPWLVSSTGIIYVNPLARLFEFVLGMCTALLFRNFPIRRLTFPLATLLECAAIAGALANMHFAPHISRLLLGNSPDTLPARDALILGQLASLSFAALIFIAAHNAGAFSRLLANPVSLLLGEISYSVYLLHCLLFTYCFTHLDITPGLPLWRTYTLFWILLLATAWIVWAGFERPLRRFIVRGTLPWHRTPTTPPAAPANPLA